MQFSIVIVNYKKPHLITQCVRSIVDNEIGVDYEIIVVDNNSQDDSEQQLRTICPDLKWIQMGCNSGFARANNAGAREACGDYILFLNADTILIEPIFEKMKIALESIPKAGVVGCRLLNKDMSLQLSYHNGDRFFCKLWRRNPLAIKLGFGKRNETDNLRNLEMHQTTHPTRWICGAAMMMRRSDISKYKFTWDEDFFMYWEDVELCYRIRKSGMEVVYLAEPSIIHLGGGGANVPLERFEMMETSKLKSMDKIHSRFYRKIYVWFIRLELRIELRLLRKNNLTIKGILKNEIEYYDI